MQSWLLPRVGEERQARFWLSNRVEAYLAVPTTERAQNTNEYRHEIAHGAAAQPV